MTDYTIVIILTLIGFVTLAAILLVPVYLFLRREERASKRWTIEKPELPDVAERPSSNGEDADAT